MRIAIKVSIRLVLVLVFALALERSSAGESARERGAAEFREKGCVHCHTIDGIGGEKGPDLSGVGRRLKKDGMRKQILDGGRAMPAFGEVLRRDEVEVLVGYLHHCRAKHASPVAGQRNTQ